MPSEAPTFQDLTAEDLTNCIKRWIEADERSVSWLAKKVKVADSTLRYQLDRPHLVRVDLWLAMLAALGRTWDDVRDELGLAGAA
jgi:hypothetical protein